MQSIRTRLAAYLVAAALLPLPGASGHETEIDSGSCSWPLRTDPGLVNVLWPDENAAYWITALPPPPPGLRYEIRGRFPKSRYFSFTSYNGLPIDTVLDEEIVPASGGNPFVAGNDRSTGEYAVAVVTDSANDDATKLHIGSGQAGSPSPLSYLIYRLYVPDGDADPTGDVGVPRLVVAAADGEATLTVAEDECEALRDAAGAPFASLHEEATQTGFPIVPPFPVADTPTQPATDPATWVSQGGVPERAAVLAGQPGLVSGGPASNPHNVYVVTGIDRALGEILVLHAKAPSFAHTDGASQMPEGHQLRYWSFCQNSRTTRYVACLRDESMTPNDDGTVTVVVSVPESIPPSAQNWIPWGPETSGLLFYRQQLPSAEFYPVSGFAAAESSEPVEDVMGEWLPQVIYCSVEEYEADRCGLDTE